VATPLADRALERLPELLKLEAAADERRVKAPRDRGRGQVHVQQPVGRHRLRFPFRRYLHRLDLHGVPHQLPRLPPDQYLAGISELLEPGGDVDGVSGHERVAFARDDLTGVDADPCLQPSLITAARISQAARTARRASSSCATGTPETAITASPTNFSTVPPCRSRICRIRS
jgi:hypothetical protein